jgi:rare lipoprotein A
MGLASCGTVSEKDSAPKRTPDISSIPDAVPKDEPRSRYGNPRQYEVFGKTYYTMQSASGYREKGIASWYGKKFHGRKTSSGEVYDMFAMTAAHKTLPLPTYVRVTNLENGRSVIVKVNDRGPFHDNRLIDLSYSAATKLGIIAKGTGLVHVEAISPGAQPTEAVVAKPSPEPVSSAKLFLQVGAFSSQERALSVKSRLETEVTDNVFITPIEASMGMLYRVRVGPINSVAYGDSLASRIGQLGFYDSHIVVE